jgi:allophanate hydrolase
MTAAGLSVDELRARYAAGESPERVLAEVYRRVAVRGARPTFIEQVPEAQALAYLARSRERLERGEAQPLFGIPFAIKDNIDLGGFPTTAGCPAFAYRAERDATAVGRLIAAGAIPIGKTNLDQFATGLVGTRSPYGAGECAFDPRYISGGSSSGSALAVAHGFASFALGTDTAGSGRIPAAFNNLVGLKPSRGLVSTRGVVPACRSLDCVSIFAGSVAEAETVLSLLAAFDAEDAFSRAFPAGHSEPIRVVGVPSSLEFFGNGAYAGLFEQAVVRLRALGIRVETVELAPFLEAAKLLYGGPWVAERFAGVGAFIAAQPEATHPVVREIVLGGRDVSGADVFAGMARLAELRRATEPVWRAVDALLLPTAGTHYTIEEVLAEPFELNARLGRYTNFVNLLDLAGIAVPAGFTPAGLPFGVTLLGPAFSDFRLAALAARFERRPAASEVLLAVAGAHLSGLPLNHQLTSRGARLVTTTRTSSAYRFYALAGTVPPKPGLVHTPGFSGPGIEVEVWALGQEAFGSFVAEVPEPMVIGSVELTDGSVVKGFLCEPHALAGSPEITELGGFRAYLARRSNANV